MVELLIIADDLTGAIDTGVQLAKQGISTTIIHHPKTNLQKLLDEIDSTVLVFNTESRHIQKQEAAKRVANVVKVSKAKGIKRFYKKTDSTMRGNIGAELDAFLKETGQNSIPFIPAHPKLKRFTKNGYHYIGEQLLHETEFGNDPLEPIKVSFLPHLLQKQSSLEIKSITTSDYDSIPENEGIQVFDCHSEKELEKIGSILFKNDLQNSIAGSAAMCEVLPVLFHLKSDKVNPPKLYEPTLIVNGSLNKISLSQVRYAYEKGIKTITIPLELLYDSKFKKNQSFPFLLAEIQKEIATEHNIILSSSNFQSETHNQNFSESHYEFMSTQIGSVVAAILNELQIGTLVVFGGDTLMRTMNSMDCQYITPKWEILPGVALSLVSLKKSAIHIVTKPGGYGENNVILQLLNYIKKSNL